MLLNGNGSFLYTETPYMLNIRLTKENNKNLINEYHRLLIRLSNYKPIDEYETQHILDIRKIYIDMIKKRIRSRGMSIIGIKELIGLCDEWAVLDKKVEDITAHTIDLIRIRSVCLDELKNRGIDKKLIKKDYL